MTAHSGLFVAPASGVGTSATDARLALAGLVGTTPQTVQGGAITQSASTMAFTIAQSVLMLPDPTNAAAAFVSPIDQTVLTPAAGPGTGSRIDLIVGKQDNPENGDADATAAFSLIAGTAGAPGTAPAVPAGYFRYADINVPAGASNAAACTVTLRSPSQFAPVDLTCPTYALLQTVTGKAGQTAVVTSDATAAYNRMWFWSTTSNTWVHSLNGATPFAEASGVANYSGIAGGSSSPLFWDSAVTITFPAGRFTVPPLLFVSGNAESGSVIWPWVTAPATATTGTVAGLRIAATPLSSQSFSWRAVQMTPTTAAG